MSSNTEFDSITKNLTLDEIAGGDQKLVDIMKEVALRYHTGKKGIDFTLPCNIPVDAQEKYFSKLKEISEKKKEMLLDPITFFFPNSEEKFMCVCSDILLKQKRKTLYSCVYGLKKYLRHC
jgi:hypothetical protein